MKRNRLGLVALRLNSVTLLQEPSLLSLNRSCRIVAVLDRVQGGFIGQTLSKYGIAGLYTVRKGRMSLLCFCIIPLPSRNA